MSSLNTTLTFKIIDTNKNNIKQAMIRDFVRVLRQSIASRSDSIYNVECTSCVMIPKKTVVTDPLVYSQYATPCLNIKCRWIHHLNVFYKKVDLFRLPAVTDNGLCIICSDSDLKSHQIGLTSSKRVVLKR